MYQIIAPTLFHNRVCKLPGIGTLSLVNHPAETDFVNSSLKAPYQTIKFFPEQVGERLFNEFSAIAELINDKLAEAGEVALKGIGIFKRGEDGAVSFEALTPDPLFLPAVTAERVIRENAEHNILVGDQQTTNVQMTEFFNQKPLLKERWKLVALILGLAALGALIYYFSRYGFNGFANLKGI